MKTITLVAVLLSAGVLLSGCASNNYQTAQGGTPPLVPVNLAAVQPPVVIVLDTIITYDGPGSWTQEAFWDEYVVTISNQGTQPLTIASAALTDFAGTSYAPSARRGALEKESKALEQKYRDAGVAFVRNAGAGAVAVGGGVRLVGAAGGALSDGVGLAAAAAGVPVPYDYVRKIDKSNNQESIVAEFTRRRLALPLTLAPGETRIGSFFFPMVANPRALSLHWPSGTSGGELTLPLESVHGLHVQALAPAVTAPRS
jgi:hypothetical protein